MRSTSISSPSTGQNVRFVRKRGTTKVFKCRHTTITASNWNSEPYEPYRQSMEHKGVKFEHAVVFADAMRAGAKYTEESQNIDHVMKKVGQTQRNVQEYRHDVRVRQQKLRRRIDDVRFQMSKDIQQGLSSVKELQLQTVHKLEMHGKSLDDTNKKLDNLASSVKKVDKLENNFQWYAGLAAVYMLFMAGQSEVAKAVYALIIKQIYR
ncbi:g2359 [Coccomyxa elongata]